MRRSIPAFSLTAILMLASSSGRAALPDPSRSEVPNCLTFCPAGDMNVRIVVRDFANNTVANSLVVLDFSSCPAFVHCAHNASDQYVIDDAAKTVARSTDGNGVADFPVRMGGTCPGHTVRVSASSVILRTCSLASPDQNGDLVVNALDAAIIAAKNGSSDATGDFDCDGTVSDLDVALVDTHNRHACDLPTLLRHRSWGQLKILYR